MKSMTGICILHTVHAQTAYVLRCVSIYFYCNSEVRLHCAIYKNQICCYGENGIFTFQY